MDMEDSWIKEKVEFICGMLSIYTFDIICSSLIQFITFASTIYSFYFHANGGSLTDFLKSFMEESFMKKLIIEFDIQLSIIDYRSFFWIWLSILLQIRLNEEVKAIGSRQDDGDQGKRQLIEESAAFRENSDKVNLHIDIHIYAKHLPIIDRSDYVRG